MDKKVDDPISALEHEINECLESKKISKKLIQYCTESKDLFYKIQDKAIAQKDVLLGLKLFSACDTCALILENVIPQLESAKQRNENPVTLEEVEDVLDVITGIGSNLNEFQLGVEFGTFDIVKIREASLVLQAEAENRKLLPTLEKRVKEISPDIKSSFAERIISQDDNNS